jgi:hypothetical protein
MKLKRLLVIICFFGITSFTFCQEFVVDKGAILLAGMGSFSSQGGELFEDLDNNRLITVNLTPALSYFITKGFFVGGSLEFANQSQGDISINGIGIGPHVGYAFGNSVSTVFPYFDVGLRYYSMSIDYDSTGDSNASGTDIFFGFGMIVPIKNHIGLSFEGGYHMIDLKDRDTDTSSAGNIFAIAVGVVGLIF